MAISPPSFNVPQISPSILRERDSEGPLDEAFRQGMALVRQERQLEAQEERLRQRQRFTREQNLLSSIRSGELVPGEEGEEQRTFTLPGENLIVPANQRDPVTGEPTPPEEQLTTEGDQIEVEPVDEEVAAGTRFEDTPLFRSSQLQGARAQVRAAEPAGAEFKPGMTRGDVQRAREDLTEGERAEMQRGEIENVRSAIEGADLPEEVRSSLNATLEGAQRSERFFSEAEEERIMGRLQNLEEIRSRTRAQRSGETGIPVSVQTRFSEAVDRFATKTLVRDPETGRMVPPTRDLARQMAMEIFGDLPASQDSVIDPSGLPDPQRSRAQTALQSATPIGERRNPFKQYRTFRTEALKSTTTEEQQDVARFMSGVFRQYDDPSEAPEVVRETIDYIRSTTGRDPRSNLDAIEDFLRQNPARARPWVAADYVDVAYTGDELQSDLESGFNAPSELGKGAEILTQLGDTDFGGVDFSTAGGPASTQALGVAGEDDEGGAETTSGTTSSEPRPSPGQTSRDEGQAGGDSPAGLSLPASRLNTISGLVQDTEAGRITPEQARDSLNNDREVELYEEARDSLSDENRALLQSETLHPTTVDSLRTLVGSEPDSTAKSILRDKGLSESQIDRVLNPASPNQ